MLINRRYTRPTDSKQGYKSLVGSFLSGLHIRPCEQPSVTEVFSKGHRDYRETLLPQTWFPSEATVMHLLIQRGSFQHSSVQAFTVHCALLEGTHCAKTFATGLCTEGYMSLNTTHPALSKPKSLLKRFLRLPVGTTESPSFIVPCCLWVLGPLGPRPLTLHWHP